VPVAAWPGHHGKAGDDSDKDRGSAHRSDGGGIAAIVFAVLFVVGFLLNTNTPEGDESNAEWVRHFADSGNRRMIVTGAILLAPATLAFLIFLGALRDRLRTAAPGTEWISTIAFASGTVFVAMVGSSPSGW
jgi:hypothetical protein